MSIEPDMSALESTANEPSGSEPSQDQVSTAQTNQANNPEPAQQITELDKLEKVKWEGKEWSLKDLKSSMMMQSDYSRKTQEIAQERKFIDNLSADLESVRQNPQLVSKFKEIYPEKYHSYLRYVSQASPAASEQRNANQLPPELTSRIDQIEKMVTDDKVAALELKLEAQDKAFSTKYPMADLEAVYARAQSLNKNGEQLTDQVWDRLWKEDHEKHQKRYETHYQSQVAKQKNANQRAKDTGAGGGTPGQAPARTKLKDVADVYLKSQGVG